MMYKAKSCSQSPWCDEDKCKCEEWDKHEEELEQFKYKGDNAKIKIKIDQNIADKMFKLLNNQLPPIENNTDKILGSVELNGHWDDKPVETDKVSSVLSWLAIIGFIIVMFCEFFIVPNL